MLDAAAAPPHPASPTAPAPPAASSPAAHPLVLAEFGYLGQCAFQANEDRARAPQLFGVTLATLAAALYSFKADGVDASIVRLVYGLLFAAECGVGGLTLRQLGRLRLSWLAAVTAQNEIATRAIAAEPALQGWFPWAEGDPPAAYNHGSVGWLMAAGVALLTGLAAAAVVFLALPMPHASAAMSSAWSVELRTRLFVCTLTTLAAAFSAFHYAYRRPLRRKDAAAAAQAKPTKRQAVGASAQRPPARSR